MNKKRTTEGQKLISKNSRLDLNATDLNQIIVETLNSEKPEEKFLQAIIEVFYQGVSVGYDIRKKEES